MGMFAPFSLILMFVFNIVMFLLLTLMMATMTLMERKILSLVQRSVGPNYMGYKGRLQFMADALKLLVKHILIVSGATKLLFLLLPALVLMICYLFWVNLLWGPNLAICEVEYNLLLMGVISMFFSFLMFIVGWATKNKYAIISSTRVLVVTLNLEVFMNFIMMFLISCFESFSFYQMVSFQHSLTWSVFLLLPLIPMILITFFLETGSIPFDLGEAESELIAGHTTEMSGFFFALFYLGEYFHLFCFSFTYATLFFGGWHVIVHN